MKPTCVANTAAGALNIGTTPVAMRIVRVVTASAVASAMGSCIPSAFGSQTSS